MSDLVTFHFLRPDWLWCLLPQMLLAGLLWRRSGEKAWKRLIDPFLLRYLVLQENAKASRLQPAATLLAFWLIATLALAGPSWQREETSFAQDRAALVFVLYTGQSMFTRDLQPSRLERAVFKIHDLLQRRPGTVNALIAYAGSAHLVVPLTSDAQLIETFAAELSPQIMPRTGNDVNGALSQAAVLLNNAARKGSIVLLTDAIPPDGLATLASSSGGYPVNILVTAAAFDRPTLSRAARVLQGALVPLTVADDDIVELAALAQRNFMAAGGQQQENWQDAGYFLTFVLAFLFLTVFRKDWSLRWP